MGLKDLIPRCLITGLASWSGQLTGGPSPSLTGPSVGAAVCSQQDDWLPQNELFKRKQGSSPCSYMLSLLLYSGISQNKPGKMWEKTVPRHSSRRCNHWRVATCCFKRRRTHSEKHNVSGWEDPYSAKCQFSLYSYINLMLILI